MGCFYLLAIVNNVAINIDIQISVWVPAFNCFRHIPRIPWSYLYGSSLFHLLRNWPNCFPQWMQYFMFPPAMQKRSNFHISPHTCYFLFCYFPEVIIITNLVGMKWYFIIVLICFSLMINDVHHHFMWLLDISIFSLEKCLFKSFVHFLIWFLVFNHYYFLLLSYSFHICWILIPYQIYKLQIFFSRSVGYLFSFLIVSFDAQMLLILMKSNFFSFSCFCFWYHESVFLKI